MNVWKKVTIRWTLNGKNVPPKTPKAKRKTIPSKRFYGTLKAFDGKKRQIPLTEDKATSETLLRRLQGIEDTKRANGADRYSEHRQRCVFELLSCFEEYLISKNNTLAHVSKTIYAIRRLLTTTKAKTLADIEAKRILKTLSDWRSRKEKPLSIGASNHYLVAIKSFSRWLWRERIAIDDALNGLRRMNAEADRRRERRALTLEEFNTLTLVTQKSNKFYRGNGWNFSPTDRVMLYTLAVYTGLRSCEIASLSKASFNLEAKTLTLNAAFTKNRKNVTLPLNDELVFGLQAWFKTLKRDVLFPREMIAKRLPGKLLKRDLKRAGIAIVDVNGRCLDFHALRYTFITSLVRGGVHPAKAQRLARHATIALTMNVYTQLDVDDLRASVNALKLTGNGGK